ncbi:MAG: single-stranded-DNA-specific exonuclease RecJ [Rhizobiaceae bacterium]|nr:single-stranded-DNA-specific exonuclease RecJ [Rhizobiaceae bacterium]
MDENKSRAFLEVENSANAQRWSERLEGAQANTALAISQTHDIPELIARVIAARGVGIDNAKAFLSPTIRETMRDPATFTDMLKAAERIADAIGKGERIAIFGDYDVDGASSSALLSRYLQHYQTPHEIYIPDRIFEGYGPNPAAIAELVEKGAGLIVTVDCGATSFEALEEAQRLKVDVVVLDHHQMGENLPPCHALVNPNRQDDLSGQGHLCAAGVVFITLVAVAKIMREANSPPSPPNLLNWLDLVALATICDVVPLKGINRAFVVKGIEVMRGRQNPGLVALADVARLDGPIEPYHLGFILGPRINAGGRIGDAALGARLLSSEDPEECLEIAQQLELLNKERQAIEAGMLEEAIAEAQAEIGDGEGPPIIITENEKWHPGIVGLLASRLKDRFKRPAFAIAFNALGKGSGSGRSISGVDLGAVVRSAVEAGILEKGGGHAMAAGLSVTRDKLAELRSYFESQLAPSVQASRANEKLMIDGALSARSATFDLVQLLERAGPYGSGHPSPIFAFPAHTIQYVERVGQSHLRLTISAGDGAKLNAIAFRAVETPLGDLLLASRGQALHVAGTLGVNSWRGQKRLQLRVIDAAKPGTVR